MRNWRTSLGGAIGVAGTLLFGGVISLHLVNLEGKWTAPLAIAGVAMSAFGRGWAAFFSADAKVLKVLEHQVNEIDSLTKGQH